MEKKYCRNCMFGRNGDYDCCEPKTNEYTGLAEELFLKLDRNRDGNCEFYVKKKVD